jgi:hypothetical protein
LAISRCSDVSYCRKTHHRFHARSHDHVGLARDIECAFESSRINGRARSEKLTIASRCFNGPFLYQLKGTPAEYKAALDHALAKGWLWLHESGTYVKFTEAGVALFA